MRPVAQVGATVAGYVLEEILGRGGMSEVYKARNPRLGNAVALKLLDPELAKDDLFRERFARESQIAASLEHPNVISIHDAGEEDGVPYIAMRYVDGGSLADLLERGSLAPDDAVAVVAQLAGALDAAHLRGLIHRDVKPANVLVDRHQSHAASPHVYLSDFGVAKHTLSRSGLTSTGQFVGTIDYVAPEQIEGKQVDQRTDVYSLGCVLYECLTGLKPFEKDSNVAVMYAHLLEPPPAPSAKRPELPAALDAVVARAMAKSPQVRYASCGELAASARAALAVPAAAAPAPAPAPVPVALPPFTEIAMPVPPPAPEPAPPVAAEPASAPVTAATKPKRPRQLPRIRARSVALAIVLAVLGVAAAAAAQTLVGGDDGGTTRVDSTRPTTPTGTVGPGIKTTRVPHLVGRTETAAKRRLRSRDLSFSVTRRHASRRKGLVLDQRRRAGVKVKKGTKVGLVVSLGPRPQRPTTTSTSTTSTPTTSTSTTGTPTPTVEYCYDRLGRRYVCGTGGGGGGDNENGGGGGGGEDHRTRTCKDRFGRTVPC